MAAVKALIITFSMYSKIPVPQMKWEEKNMKLSIAFLPLVALPMGLAGWIWIIISNSLNLNIFFFAVGLTIIPIFITGGIHMDGFADTIDALASHTPPEKRREILKDPHTGAFAIIGICSYFLIYSGMCSELDFLSAASTFNNFEAALLLFFCYSAARITGSFAVLCLPSSKSEGILATFKSASDKSSIITLAAVSLLILGYSLTVSPGFTICIIGICILCFLFIRSISNRCFGGMSGDLAGYIIQINELLLVIALVILQKAVLI